MPERRSRHGRRNSSLETRCRTRIKSPRTSSRTRTRSRAASWLTVGTRTETISSSRSSRASSTASRLSVLTRSPAGACQLRGCGDLAADPDRCHRPGQTKAGGPSLVGHRDRPGQGLDPVQNHLVGWHQSLLEQLTCRGVDRRRDNRSCVHIEPNARTLSKHRGLPTMSDRPSIRAPAR
jgi:hypothetical protein